MAINTTAVVRGNLTVKSSPNSPLDYDGITKLERSLAIAQVMVMSSLSVIIKLRREPDPPMAVPQQRFVLGAQRWNVREDALEAYSKRANHSDFSSLCYHFGLPRPFGKDSEAVWIKAMDRVWSTYTKILSGLRAPVSIADAHATIFEGAMRDTNALWAQRQPQLFAQHEQLALAQKRMFEQAGLPPPSAREMVAEIAEKMQRAEAAFKLPKAQRALEDAMSTAGQVKLKKGFQNSLSLEQKAQYINDTMRQNPFGEFVPALSIRPDQKSSIHINFHTKVKQGGVSDVSLATIIVHEASHKFANTLDHAYVDNELYRQVESSRKLWNADSYAYCAASLYADRLVMRERDMPATRGLV